MEQQKDLVVDKILQYQPGRDKPITQNETIQKNLKAPRVKKIIPIYDPLEAPFNF